jgi:hypothetical protein
MAEAPWQWDAASRRYRNAETGRFLSADRVRALRDSFVSSTAEAPQALTSALAAGDLTLPQWEAGMRLSIKQSFLAAGLLGRGGKNAADPSFYGALGVRVKAQYGFLGEFAREIAKGELSEAQIAARGGMYLEAARSAFEQGRAASFSIDLPAYPGDGQSQCLTRCRYGWDLAETEAEVQATWVLGGSNHCPDCGGNAARWNPLVFPKGEGRAVASINGRAHA